MPKKIGDLIRNDVLTRSKVRFVNKGFSTTFGYSLQVDGVAIGQQNNDLTVNVVTDLSAADAESYNRRSSEYYSAWSKAKPQQPRRERGINPGWVSQANRARRGRRPARR